MFYPFPLIHRIEPVLSAIEGCDQFRVQEKNDYIVINYSLANSQVFPEVAMENPDIGYSPYEPEYNYDLYAALRRECRGIIFDKQGNIIRRPYHKFWNLGERVETQPDNIDFNGYELLDKCDGSMIVPFILNNKIEYGSKAGITDMTEPVYNFIESNKVYQDLSEYLLSREFNPIFEWCSRKQRIVIDHPEDKLILTAIRHINTGEYFTHQQMADVAAKFKDIQLVKVFNPFTNLDDFVTHTRNLVDTEGYVARYSNGHMFKAKSDWYVAIHKAKEKILYDRLVVELILDENLDDVKPHLDLETRARICDFEDYVTRRIHALQTSLRDALQLYNVQMKLDRKTFALEYADAYVPILKQLIFQLWETNPSQEVLSLELERKLRLNLINNTKYEIFKDQVFEGVSFNET